MLSFFFSRPPPPAPPPPADGGLLLSFLKKAGVESGASLERVLATLDEQEVTSVDLLRSYWAEVAPLLKIVSRKHIETALGQVVPSGSAGTPRAAGTPPHEGPMANPCGVYDGVASAGTTACCAKSCRVCEQLGCQRRGVDNCCVDAIHLAGARCQHALKAPCVLAPAVMGAPLRYVPSDEVREQQASEYAVAADAARIPSSSDRFLPPIPCREDLPFVAERRFRRTGRAAEVGVFRGLFSQHNLRVWSGEYYAIDAWAFRAAEGRTDNWDQAFQDANLAHAKRNTRFAGPRVHLVQNRSTDAARAFPEAHFDWIYIDALHTRRAVLEDLRAWYPKLRPGGLLSGDDYGDVSDTPFLSAARWRQVYGMVAVGSRWGTVSALHQFAASHGLQLSVTWMRPSDRTEGGHYIRPNGSATTSYAYPTVLDRTWGCYPFPAWYLVKPH